MTLKGPDGLYEITAELAASAQADLTAAGGRYDRACPVPGAIAVDACECGLLAVSVTRTYLTSDFPTEQGAGGAAGAAPAGPCAAAFLAADLTVQAMRCAPGPDSQGEPPSCPALAAAAREVTSDAWHVRRAVTCRLQDLLDGGQLIDYQVGAQSFMGPEGGCVGSALAVTVAVDNPCDCGP